MIIRAAHADDVPSLVELYSDWGHPQPAEFIAARLVAWEATAHAAVLVAEIDHTVAAVSLTASIGPPGSASEIAMPATNGARLSRVHSSSLKSAFDVMSASWFVVLRGLRSIIPSSLTCATEDGTNDRQPSVLLGSTA